MDMDYAGLELFQERQYLDPHLMTIGKRNLRKRQLQKRLMEAQPRSYGHVQFY